MKAAWTAAGLLLLTADGAVAHPLDEVVQGAYLTLAPGVVRLELDLSPGTQVSAAMLKALDANGDRVISGTEGRVFGAKVLKTQGLALDGAAVGWTLERVTTPAYDAIRLGGDTVKIYAVARRADRAGGHSLAYDNRYEPGAKSQCAANVFLQPSGGWRYQVIDQERGADNRRLTVRYDVRR